MSDDGWVPSVRLDELADRKPTRVSVDGVDVLLVRDGERLFAIGNRCSHQGAPLSRGPVTFAGSVAQVTCAVHRSAFNLGDGSVARGPAVRPVPAYDVRVSDGVVELRSRD